MSDRSVWRLVLLSTVALASLGCMPRVRVAKNPGPFNHGIRYYRPKPYLLITPAGEQITTEVPGAEPGKTTKKVTTTQSDEFVHIQLEYLPDFSEEYAISVSPGLGSANVGFKLENGWNLTEVNQELDTQFDEDIGAIADLVSAVGSVAAPGGLNLDTTTQPNTIKKKWAVRSTNVPIGYYEAVIGKDPNCKKRLYGWRYVGFAPFNSCPTDVVGSTVAHCEGDPNGPIYGLVFEAGAIQFKQLNEIPLEKCYERVCVPTATFDAKSVEHCTALSEQIEQTIELDRPAVTVDIDNDLISITIQTVTEEKSKRNRAEAVAIHLAQQWAAANGMTKAQPRVQFEEVESLPAAEETRLDILLGH